MANDERKLAQVPQELITEILLRQPVKSLIRFRFVSKPWRDQISSSDFFKLRQSRFPKATNSDGSIIFYRNTSLYTYNFCDPFHRATIIRTPLNRKHATKLVGSCNGVLCFQSHNNQFALYNPATQAFKRLPNPWNIKFYYVMGDFAYDSVGDDYKVLRNAAYYDAKINGISEETHLYSLKTNSWAIVQNPPYSRYYRLWRHRKLCCRSVVANNSLHWYDDDVIWCFDLFTRGYHQMPMPLPVRWSFNARLGVLRGYLHIITNSFDIWVMKEYGVPESWTRLFGGLSRPLGKILGTRFYDHEVCPLLYAYSKNGQKILVGVQKEPKNFIYCDLERQAATKFEIPGLPIAKGGRFVVEPWVESIVPLGDQ